MNEKFLSSLKLSPEDSILAKSAIEASQGSFSPLSKFAVGAALLVEDANGQKHIVQGTNYETQNFRSVCAEKHALQTAHLKHSANGQAPKFLQIAIFAPKHNSPIFPCGDCRQALLEANPGLKVLSIGSAGEISEHSIAELLPHGFKLEQTGHSCRSIEAKAKDYIVHFPLIENRLDSLKGIESLIVVGSPIRAAKLAEHFRYFSDWEPAIVNTYCHIVSGETDREYSLFSVEWPQQKFKLGIASHGIGASGIEIILSEIGALLALANETEVSPIKAVVRSGTRGTIADVPLGTIALTTESYNEESHNAPSVKLTEALRKAAKNNNVILEEGPGLSAQFFWSGQGRTAFPLSSDEKELATKHDTYLRSLLKKGIKWIEMEDFYLNHFASKFGIQSASVGVVVAKRYDAQSDQFVLSYDAQAKKDGELIPAELALQALRSLSTNGADLKESKR
jgi:cytidine deaminase